MKGGEGKLFIDLQNRIDLVQDRSFLRIILEESQSEQVMLPSVNRCSWVLKNIYILLKRPLMLLKKVMLMKGTGNVVHSMV